MARKSTSRLAGGTGDDPHRAAIAAGIKLIREGAAELIWRQTMDAKALTSEWSEVPTKKLTEPSSSTPSPLLAASYPDEPQQPYSGPELGQSDEQDPDR